MTSKEFNRWPADVPHGRVYMRCPACQRLTYDPREAACVVDDTCRYTAQCPNCGNTIHPEDHDPDNWGACSESCAAEVLASIKADEGATP